MNDAQAQQSPAAIGKAIAKTAAEINKKRKDCLNLSAFLIKFSEKIEDGDLTDAQIELFGKYSDGCAEKADELFEGIDAANGFLGGGDEDEGDLPEEFAKVGVKVSAFGVSGDMAAETEPMPDLDPTISD